MRIATWNVNSIRQRMDSLQAWLKERAPDIVCLQEIKCTDDAFPREPFEALGYNVAVHGQKTFNGVALLSKLPFDEVKSGLDRRRRRRAGPLPGGAGLDQRRRAAGGVASICPMAMAATKNMPTNSNGWTGWLSFQVNG